MNLLLLSLVCFGCCCFGFECAMLFGDFDLLLFDVGLRLLAFGFIRLVYRIAFDCVLLPSVVGLVARFVGVFWF